MLAAAQPQPTGEPIGDVRADDRSDWEAARVWIIIGGVALALLAVAIVLSFREGGKTVLKE
jgi:hypothetical protein